MSREVGLGSHQLSSPMHNTITITTSTSTHLLSSPSEISQQTKYRVMWGFLFHYRPRVNKRNSPSIQIKYLLNPMKSLTWIIDSLMGLREWCWSWSLRATMMRRSFNIISISVSDTPPLTNQHHNYHLSVHNNKHAHTSTSETPEHPRPKYKSPQVELTAGQGTLRAQLKHWVKACACLLWETLSNYTLTSRITAAWNEKGW